MQPLLNILLSKSPQALLHMNPLLPRTVLAVPRTAASSAQDPSGEIVAPTTTSGKSIFNTTLPNLSARQTTNQPFLFLTAAQHLDTVTADVSPSSESATHGRLVARLLSRTMDSAATSITRPARVLVMATAVPSMDTGKFRLVTHTSPRY
jgi:hypothetical protein